MDKSKKNEINNIFSESSKYYNDEYNTLLNSNNNKMDINDLSNTNNMKLSARQNNNNNIINDVEFQKMKFSKKAAYSMAN